LTGDARPGCIAKAIFDYGGSLFWVGELSNETNSQHDEPPSLNPSTTDLPSVNASKAGSAPTFSRHRSILARVRFCRRRVDKRLVCVAYFISAHWKMWPVSIVIAILTFCFFLPGLASNQTIEALLRYVKFGDAIEIVWLRYFITLCSTIALGAVLRNCSRQLLTTGSPALPTAYPFWLSLISGYFPLAAISLGLFTLNSDSLALSNPFALMAAGLLVIHLLQDRFKILTRWFHPLSRSWRSGNSSYSGTIVSWLLLAAVLIMFATSERDTTLFLPFSLVYASQVLGPINVILLTCCLWTAIITSLVVTSRRTRIPILGILATIVIVTNVSGLNDNHVIRRSQEATITNDIEPAFLGWLDERPDKGDLTPYPVILVSAEGGGIRAAFFTAISLARMVDGCPRIASHIFAISGVSGGAIGAAVFAAAMKARPPDTKDKRCDLTHSMSHDYEDAVSEVLSDDHLSPLLVRMLTGDTFQQLLPFAITNFDRQLGLEFSLERSFHRVFKSDGLSEPLYRLVPTRETPSIPYLFLNTTRVEDGLRVTLSPLYFRPEQYGGSDDWHALDYFNGPPISAAAGTSARFPLISPPGYFVSRNVKEGVVGGQKTWVPDPAFVGTKNRYVDGGYFDDSGAPTLLELYNAIIPTREPGRGPAFFVRVLHIGNTPICSDNKGALIGTPCKPADNYSTRSGLLTDFLSIFKSAMNVRDTRVDYGLKQLFNELQRTADAHSDIGMTDFSGTEEDIAARAEIKVTEQLKQYPGMLDSHSRIQMHERGVPVPLGWLLSSRAARDLRSQIDAVDFDCETDRQTNECEMLDVLALLEIAEPTPPAH
jgi:hypothetical protein